MQCERGGVTAVLGKAECSAERGGVTAVLGKAECSVREVGSLQSWGRRSAVLREVGVTAVFGPVCPITSHSHLWPSAILLQCDSIQHCGHIAAV